MWKMKDEHCRPWTMLRKLKIMENEKHTVGCEIWQETLKKLKNEKCTLQDLEYGEKTEKNVENEHKYCMTQNMARNTEKLGK